MLEIVAGPPFAGKSQYVDAEIERRAAAGERGLLKLDFTDLYSALFPAIVDEWRDAGTPGVSLTAYIYQAVLRQAKERELDGYVTTSRALRALKMAEELEAPKIKIIDPGRSVVRRRADKHAAELWKRVAIMRRAERQGDEDIRRTCEEAIDEWYADANQTLMSGPPLAPMA